MNLLVISDKRKAYDDLEKILSRKGYPLFYSSKREDFYSLIRTHEIRVILLNLKKNEIQDFTLLKAIKNFDPLIDIIIIGPVVSAAKMIESIKLGAMDYLAGAVEEEMLLSTLKKIEDKMLLRRKTYQLEEELTKKYVFEGMVGRNYNMLEVFSLIERVAKYSTSVLITGATGTGKEMVAQAIHNLSPRKDKKMIVCDCTAIPESLFESELFGYVRGAFTGAEKSKMGLFEEADRGTIFLDEIGEIPISIQTKLLRFLEERYFRRLGSNEIVKVNVRVICSTNRDLRENIRAGTFREDLFHRINVAEIHLPPLRERRDDIPLLCSYFLEKYNQKFNKDVKGISQRAKKILMNYSWPGNVREIENLIERAVMLSRERFIDVKDLPEIFLKYQSKEEVSDLPYPYSHLGLEEIEKKHILEILKAADFNKQKAARMLGLTRQALYRKINKLHIPM